MGFCFTGVLVGINKKYNAYIRYNLTYAVFINIKFLKSKCEKFEPVLNCLNYSHINDLDHGLVFTKSSIRLFFEVEGSSNNYYVLKIRKIKLKF